MDDDDSLVEKRKSNDDNNDVVLTKLLKEAISNFGVNDWDELMKPFTEISHDDLTKKMNAFVKERRWKDAVTALGIKEKDLKGMMQQTTSKQQSHVNNEDEQDVIMSNNNNDDDMGELVYMDQGNADDTNDTKRSSSSSNYGDDNMARVLNNKRKLDHVAPTPAKRKKRRKKKKKSGAVNDAEIDQKTDNVAVESTATGSNDDSAGNIMEKVENESATAACDDVDDLPLQQSILPCKAESLKNEHGEVLLDTDRSESDVKSDSKKVKKKSKKKKKKTKKSRNVIDDIFG